MKMDNIEEGAKIKGSIKRLEMTVRQFHHVTREESKLGISERRWEHS